MKKRIIIFLAAALAAMCAWAVEVSPATAELAVRNWVARHKISMRTSLSENVETAQTIKEGDKTLFHLVPLEGGGFIVVSGDTKITPVIAFSDSGEFSADETNPLYVIAKADMARRLEAIENASAGNQASTGKSRLLSASSSSFTPSAPSPETEWESLTGEAPSAKRSRLLGASYLSNNAITDLRVPPLITTRWNQSGYKNVFDSAIGQYTFNRYTPGHSLCGCVAIAYAQVMKYWQWPDAAHPVMSFTEPCEYNGVATNVTAFGGVYDWSLMPDYESNITRIAQCEAIGKLCYDMGVAAQTSWTQYDSGAEYDRPTVSLTNNFHYASVEVIDRHKYSGGDYTGPLEDSKVYADAILGDLDAAMPCVLGIHPKNAYYGHAVVADGYGYVNGTLYCHVNFGWGGEDGSTAWYNLFNGNDSDFNGYSFIYFATKNFHPTETGSVLSGRITTPDGKGVSGATVILTRPDRTVSTTFSSDTGIYSFRTRASGEYMIGVAQNGTTPQTTQVVSIDHTVNMRNVNFTLELQPDQDGLIIVNEVLIAYAGSGGDVTIPETVTKIMEGAFSGCATLTSVAIPNSVTSIGTSAFSGCSGLTNVVAWLWPCGLDLSQKLSVTIPDGVTSIESRAFSGCSGLTSVTIPSSVTSIGYDAFSGCRGLTSVTIPDSVTNIGEYAFSSCSGLTSMTIPGSVTSIGHCAFEYCSGLTSVTIPDSVTSIGIQAFYGCSGLTSVTIPDSVTSIDGSVFGGCSCLASVTIPDSVTSIGEWAFEDCSGLTRVAIGNSVTSIGYKAFYGCSGLTSVTIPDSVTSIGRYAFSGCSGLTSVTIPDSVTSIGDYAFRNCSGLTNVTIPNSVTSIGSSAFSGCSGLTSVTIPDSVTSIGYEAFSGCSGLTSVTIPNSVTSIGSSAFSGCSGLEDITLPFVGLERGNSESSSSLFGYIFGTSSYTDGTETRQCYSSYYSTYSTYCIPSKLTKVVVTDETIFGYGAFYNCSGLASVTIPDSVTNIENGAFYGCSGLTTVTIPNSVTSIGSYAFSGCSGLTSVTIPDSVTSIGAETFSSCSGLTSVTIPDSVTSIGYEAFSGCSGLVKIMVEEGNEEYKSENGVLLTKDGEILRFGINGDVTIPVGVTSIDYSAFSGCSGLTSVTIPDSVTSIGRAAFYGCSGLTNVTIPNSVTSIGGAAFSGCSGLTNVTIGNGVTSIGDSAFYGCSGLTSLTIPNSVTSIGGYAFSGCSGLTSVTIPDSVTSIGSYAFSGCGGLVTVYVSSGDAERVRERMSRSGVDVSGIAFVEVKCVTFASNGGKVDVSSRRVSSGSAVGTLPVPVHTGYTFVGWFTEASGGTQISESTTVTDDVTYYAHWNVTVTFDAKDGKFSNGASTKTVVAKPGNLWGKLPMPAKSGYVFDGYYTTASGGTMITASSEVPAENVTYYAHWTPRLGLAAASEWGGAFDTDTWCGQGTVAHDGRDALRSGIIYDGQSSYLITRVSGSGVLTFWWAVSCEAGGKDALRFIVDGEQKELISGDVGWTKVEVPIRGVGTHILKWNYTKNGSVTKGEDFGWIDQISWSGSDVDAFYFDANGGKFSNGSTVKRTDAPEGNLWGKMYMPARDGYVFAGWYTDKDGGNLVTSSDAVPFYYTTYYAHWTPRLGLAAASEWSREFTTDSWCGQGAVSHDGRDALRSGIIYDGQSSYILTRVPGPGTLTFWWKVSCEAGGNDALRLLVDGAQIKMISGEVDWTKVEVPITGSGSHVIKWNYTKNGSVTKGEDFGWIDQMSWVGR